MTRSAKRFMNAISISWDSPEPWEKTARGGLSEYDRDVVRGFAREENELFSAALREIIEAVKEKVER